MGKFDFSNCVVEGDIVLCLGQDGKIYKFSTPQVIDVANCPPCLLNALLKAIAVKLNSGGNK
jgi:hypothetical protein